MQQLSHFFIEIEIPILLLLIVTGFFIKNTLAINEFRYVCLAWTFNLLYLFTFIITNHFGFNAEFSLIIITLFDLLCSYCFLKASAKFINRPLFNWFNNNQSIVVFIFLVSGAIKVIPFSLVHDHIPYIVFRYFPATLIDYFALRSLALYFKKLTTKFEGYSRFLFIASMVYALIQFWGIVQSDSFGKIIFPSWNLVADTDAIGMGIGLATKFVILICLIIYIVVARETELFEKIQIDKAKLEKEKIELELQAKKIFAEKLNQIIGRTFHEITPPLQEVEYIATLLANEDNKRSDIPVNKRVRYELEKIDSAIHRMRVILTASSKMYHSDVIRLSPETTEINFPIPIDEEEGIQNINTLVEIAIMNFKSSKFRDLANDFYVTNKIKFHTEYGSNCNVNCNSVQMVQVFYNLFQNSYEAVLDHDYFCNIFIKTKNINEEDGTGKKIRIEIEDSGPGIPTDKIEHIFDQGFTTKVHSGRGRGFGLNIVKSFSERNGGTVIVESPPGHSYLRSIDRPGTKFTINFPKPNITII